MHKMSELATSLQDTSECESQLCFEFYNPEYAELNFLHLASDFASIIKWENEQKRKGYQNYEIAQMEMMQ